MSILVDPADQSGAGGTVSLIGTPKGTRRALAKGRDG